MSRQVTCYIGGEQSTAAGGFRSGWTSATTQSIRSYCQAAGLPVPASDETMPEEVVPGPILEQAIASTLPGSAFVTNGLGSFGAKPSEQRERILALLGKDVDVHVLGLGRIDDHIGILKLCWSAFAELERQLADLERDYADQEQRLRDRMAAFEDKLIARMAETVGQSSVKLFYGANGSHAPEPEPVTDPTALHVKQLREARKWSMEELAEKAGTSKGMIQRIETKGKGEALGRVLSVLEHGAAQ